jgi:hypothetical protein
MEPLALAVGFVLAVLVLLRMPGGRSPVPVTAQGNPWPATPSPDDDEEQLPETDRAPQRSWLLPWAVASVAALRLVLLLTLRA